ncbi:MAG: ComEC/Rec2 family competence protein [Opitutaceae bacterium]|nr:ComEC/Rec2 family competence protein [Opitutaceae bacterium]
MSRSLGHRAPLLWLVLPFIGGLVAGKLDLAGPPLGLLAAAVPLIGVAWWGASRAPRLWAPAIAAGMLCAGGAAYGLHRARLPAWDSLPAREAKLSLRVDRVFVSPDARRASGLATVLRGEDHLRELAGQRLYFSLALRAGEAAPIRSAELATIGVIVTLPRNPPADTFDGYLAGAGMNFRLTRGRVLAEERPALPYYRFCARAAAWCHATLGRGIAEKRPELAGLLRALLLGAKHELSDEQHTLFMRSGTMHLFAISGLHVGVIAAVIHALLAMLRLPVGARFVAGTAALWLFVDITGASPSAVRAFAMVVCLQAAWLLRRPGNPVAALVASALAVLLVAPLQVFSASFQMSYSIVAALLVLGLPLSDAWLARWALWRDLPKAAWRWWQHGADQVWRTGLAALAIGVATTLVSLLTSVQFFQLLTPAALIANLALIPAAMVVTLGGFASLLCGLVGFGPGAVLCNHAAALVLLAIESLVRAGVQVPGAFLSARFAAPWIGPTALAALLATLLAGYALRWQQRGGGWWPPFALVALVLLFGVTFGPR